MEIRWKGNYEQHENKPLKRKKERVGGRGVGETLSHVGTWLDGAWDSTKSMVVLHFAGSLFPRPFLYGQGKKVEGEEGLVLFSDRIFFHPPEKWVLSTASSIFVQVRQEAGALFFSNLPLDIIEDCILQCVPMIY